jgi:Protein of unknown function (DUF2924)
MPRPSFDREVIEVEIGRVRSLDLDALRTLWRVTFRSSPPPAFTKDLVARFLCWHIQEQAQGGLDPETAKHLDGRTRGDKPGADRPRRLKPGTVLLREYQGERHTVTVVPNGYLWRETTFASLSTIARAITGTSWNGPRFFGLRSDAKSTASSEAANVSSAPDNKRHLIRAAKSHPAGAAQNLVGDLCSHVGSNARTMANGYTSMTSALRPLFRHAKSSNPKRIQILLA